MFTDFYYTLKNWGVPISLNEWQTLLEALENGMAGSSLTGFYYLCRALLVKTEAHYDRFDVAFAQYFGAVETPEGLPEKIWEWLNKEVEPRKLPPAMLEKYKQLDLQELQKMLEERLAEQKEEHHGGNYWVGTGGTSPFGHSGYHPGGIRIGGASHNMSAVKVAGMRKYLEFRTDETLGVRQFQIALRKLRQFNSRLEGQKTDLDLDATVNKTCDNAGRLELIWERPRVNNIKVMLLMDVSGSMYSYSRLCSQLFTAVNRSNHFKDLKVYYFHNCIYDYLYHDAYCSTSNCTDTEYILKTLSPEYRVIIMGDASMAPYELTHIGGIIDWSLHNDRPGLEWLQMLRRRFEYSVWLNPISQRYWRMREGAYTINMIKEIFPMEELTIDGLEAAIKKLKSRQAAAGVH